MFRDRPSGDRFFARVTAFEIACPRCAEIAIVGEGRKNSTKIFDRKKSIFCCRHCGLHLAIGILAWPLRNGPTGMPEDIVPTYREGMRLRELMGLLGVVPDDHTVDAQGNRVDQRHGAREPVNVVIRTECRCRQLEPRGNLVHPECPVHGEAGR